MVYSLKEKEIKCMSIIECDAASKITFLLKYIKKMLIFLLIFKVLVSLLLFLCYYNLLRNTAIK